MERIPSFDEVFELAWVIIVAGGTGTRMNSTKPKQFLLLNNKPILLNTIDQFIAVGLRKIVLVLPSSHIEKWQEIQDKYDFKYKIKVVEGGKTRTESVKNGLAIIPKNSTIVGIHDAVRPLVSSDIIQTSFASAYMFGSGVPCVKLKDSIRKLEKDGSIASDRNDFVSVQTPQVFEVNGLRQAYELLSEDNVSDDATVWERSGREIRLTEGDYTNIKITTPEDLLFAKLLTGQTKV